MEEKEGERGQKRERKERGKEESIRGRRNKERKDRRGRGKKGRTSEGKGTGRERLEEEVDKKGTEWEKIMRGKEQEENKRGG